MTQNLFPSDSSRTAPKLPKVVRIIGRLNVGGPAQQACSLHEKLRDTFHTVLVAGRLNDGEADMSYLLNSAEQVHFVGSMARSVNLACDLIAFFRILFLIKKEKPDIVHTHTAKAGALGRLAAWLLRVPFRVHTYHGHVFDSYFGPVKSKIFVKIERFLNRRTSRIIAISNSQAEDLVNHYRVVPRDKLSVIRLGFDLEKFHVSTSCPRFREQYGILPKAFVVLWAGRLVPIKHVELLAEIVKLAASNPRLCFVIAGDGSERKKLESLTAGCKNIVLTGWVRDMTQAWAGSDLALLTSRNEGTPVALIEAMAAGKPVVATAVGGVIDLVSPPEHGSRLTSGFLKAGNGYFTAPDARIMLNCIEEISRDNGMAIEMGVKGRAFVQKHYGVDRLSKEIEALYNSMMKEKPSDMKFGVVHSRPMELPVESDPQ